MGYEEAEYPFGPEWMRSKELWCGQYNIKNLTNWGWFGILVIGLILISFLIYRKHKGEEGLWRKILKWDFIFFLIMFIIKFIWVLALRVIGGPVCPVYLYEGI